MSPLIITKAKSRTIYAVNSGWDQKHLTEPGPTVIWCTTDLLIQHVKNKRIQYRCIVLSIAPILKSSGGWIKWKALQLFFGLLCYVASLAVYTIADACYLGLMWGINARGLNPALCQLTNRKQSICVEPTLKSWAR